MGHTQLHTVVCHLRRLADPGRVSEPPDPSLLQRFTEHGDEAAFRTLVERHGPGVLRVCRGVLHDRQAAEDAFQATFLTLARKAASIRKPAALAAPSLVHAALPPELARLAVRAVLQPTTPTLRSPWTATVLLAATLCVGGLLALSGFHAPPQQKGPTPSSPATEGRGPRADLFGDPLPPGALARCGTVRLRHGDAVSAVAFSPDGSSDFKAVCLWDVVSGKELRRCLGHGIPIWSVAFSADGGTLVSGGDDGTVRLWDVATGRERRSLRGHTREVRAVAFAPDGRSVASGSFDGTVRVWDVTTGKGRIVGKHGHIIFSVAFSPDGRKLASAGKDDPVRLWDVTTARQIREFERQHTHKPRNTAAMWRVGPGGKMQKIEEKDLGRDRTVHGVCFSPDGRTLASAESDHSVFLWEVETGKPRRDLEGHRGEVFAVAFAADGRTLASAGYDLTALVWDVSGRHGRPTPRRRAATPGPKESRP